jgi:glutathione S-transferase
MNEGIGDGPFVAGPAYGVCDIYLAMITRWSRYLDRPAWRWPNLKRAVAATFPRPAFQRTLQKQGVFWAENWPSD